MSVPAELLYTQHDEWIRREGDVVTIGITDYAQDALGELVHVELPEVGRVVAAGEAIAEVESVKAVAEVYTAVSGEVIEVNSELDGSEEQINNDAYGAWLFKIRLSDDAGLSGLLDAAAYAAKIAH
jgi:glycine cleavage system H protein